MADYLASILITEKEIRDAITGRGTPFSPQLTTDHFAPAPASFDRLDAGSLERWSGNGQRQSATDATQPLAAAPIHVTINLILNREPNEEDQAFIDRITPRIEDTIAAGVAAAQARAGNPLAAGS
jgi:hypothetical protein